jgi:signal transduction histidine kinase
MFRTLFHVGITDQVPPALKSKIILTNQLIAFGILLALLQALVGVLVQNPSTIYRSLIIAIVGAACSSLNYFGFWTAGRFTLVTFLSWTIALVCAAADGASTGNLVGAKILLISFVMMPMVIFGSGERLYRYLGAGITLIPFIIFDYLDAQLNFLPADTNAISEVTRQFLALCLLLAALEYLNLRNEGARKHIEKMLQQEQQQSFLVRELNEELGASQEELRQNLEELQASREEIERQNRELAAQNQHLRTAQTQIIQSEKLATLGTLIAGVAHEINTPLGAIQAASHNLSKSVPQAIEKLPEAAGALPSEELICFEKLIAYALQNQTSFTTREERQYKKQVQTFLETNQIPNSNLMALELVKAGLVSDLEQFLPVFRSERAAELLEVIGIVGKLRLNIENIQIAVAKTQKIVFALKSYSHRQYEEKPVPGNLRQNIEIILTLYHNQLKHGIEVNTVFPDNLPLVPMVFDELNQVWTNLIHNAIQAMKGVGKLDIVTEIVDDTQVVVHITDSGSGIPPEVLPRIFEPFFTTKPQGEGTGLGLDICRRIIQKHNGRIEVRSVPGRTTFSTYLPVYIAENNPPVLETAGQTTT